MVNFTYIYKCDISQASASPDGVILTTNATGILEASSNTLKPKASARLTVQLLVL